MSNYDNTDSGALFKNKDKTPDKPNWADYQGTINVGGTEYWISAWIKKPKKGGDTFMSLSVKEKQAPQGQSPHSQRTNQVQSTGDQRDGFEDDIPF